MTLSNALRVTGSGMAAERLRMDVTASNIANSNSVNSPGQPAYRRRYVILNGDQNGVKVDRIAVDNSELRRVADPTHPLADSEGYVYYSNVEPIKEMVNMLSANRAYEANIAAFNSAKGMIRSALQIGRL